MSNLIRGGQVTLHKYRMLMQVGKVFLRLSVAIILFSFTFCYYNNISKQEWQIGFDYLKQEISNSISLNSSKNSSKIKLSNYFLNKQFERVNLKFQTTWDEAVFMTEILHLILVGGVIAFFLIRGRALKQNSNIRGVFLNSAQELKQSINKHNRQYNGLIRRVFRCLLKYKDYRPFKLADFAYPITGRKESWTAGEQSHTLILGSTGAGKTKIIQDLVYQLHKRDQKAIIVDVKGDYIERFYRKNRGDIILNPLDQRGRNWSIFKETNPLKGFSTLAKSLLPKESKSDPIWVEAARNVFAELANLYVSENLSMAEFADKILKTDLKILNKLLENTSAARIVNPEIEKAALSVLMVLSTYLKPLKLYQSNQDIFSITDWINDNTQNNFLFISSRADVKEDINPLITTQVDIAVNALRSLKEQSNIPKIWFILDEIPYFDQSIPSLKDGLAMARSYGGCFVLGSQDMSSIAKIYSEETARSIANNCKTKIYMNIAGKEAASWCSGSLGEGEIEEWHEGLSYGAHEMRDGIQVNQNKIIRPIVLSSELMMLKAGEGYINFAGFRPAKFKFSDSNFKKIAESYVENSSLLDLFKKELEIGEAHRKMVEKSLAKNNNKNPRRTKNRQQTNSDNLTKIAGVKGEQTIFKDFVQIN